MNHIVPLIVASFMPAIAMAMLEDGPLTLPFLIGYLLSIVVPLVTFSGVLTLVAAGVYRLYTRKNMPNLFAAMWGIWVLVASVNFFGNYQSLKERRAEQALQTFAEQIADPYVDWRQGQALAPGQQAEEGSGKLSAVLALQAGFVRSSQQLDKELASKVAGISIPRLFDAEFLNDKSRFPAATEQLEEYGQLFQEHKQRRMEMLSEMKAEIELLDLPQKEKLQAVQEFNNTYELDGTLSQKYFDIVIEVSRKSIAYLDFLKQAHYRVSNGQVTFETNEDSNKNRVFLETFKHLSEQEASTQRELADSRKKRMVRLRELSR